MTKQELLKPRYEVIADYPKSHFQIGDLIKMKEIYPYSGYSYELQGGDIAAPEYFDQYPHLFKPLSWWQHRELKDMPEYVKVVNPHYTWELPKGCVRKVAEWKFNDNNNLFCDIFPIIIPKGQLHRIEPADLSDYENYLSQLKSEQ